MSSASRDIIVVGALKARHRAVTSLYFTWDLVITVGGTVPFNDLEIDADLVAVWVCKFHVPSLLLCFSLGSLSPQFSSIVAGSAHAFAIANNQTERHRDCCINHSHINS